MLKWNFEKANKYFDVSTFQPKISCFKNIKETLHISKNHFDFSKTA